MNHSNDSVFKYRPEPDIPPSREDRSTAGWISALTATVMSGIAIIGEHKQEGWVDGLATGLLAYCLLVLILPHIPKRGWSAFQWAVAISLFIIAISVRTR
jgi:hypothetical protein